MDGGCSSLPLHFGFAVEGIQEKEFICGYVFNPPDDAWMRMKTAQFRYNIGVEQIHGLTRSWETCGGDAAAGAASVRRCVPPA